MFSGAIHHLMNSSTYTSRFLSQLALVSAIAATAVTLGFAFGQYPIASFATATSGFMLLIARRDYAPRQRRWQPCPASVANGEACPAHRYRLAA